MVRRRLAVSTVVASMLMILITMSLAAGLVAWASTSYGGFTGGSQPYYVQRQEALEEQFVIENVFLTKSNARIDVFVRNVGASIVGIVAVYVNEIPETPTGYSDNVVASSGQVGSCTFPSSSSTNPSGAFFLGTTSTSPPPIGSGCNQTPPKYPNMVDFNVQITTVLNGNCPTQPWCTGDILYITVASEQGNQATYSVGAP